MVRKKNPSSFIISQTVSAESKIRTILKMILPEMKQMWMAMDMTTFVFRLYQAVSDENGDYKLGVLPGTLTSLNAQKDGYNVVAPSFPYVQIAVFNTNGQKVRSLLSGFLRPGEHQI